MRPRQIVTCGALILAAGASTRLGRPKQVILLDGETLLERAVRIAEEAGCDPVLVVLGASADLIQQQCKMENVWIIVNPDWATGMGTSIACGARSFNEVSGIVVMTCDMPAVTAAHLERLAQSREITASAYAGRKGVPAFFPRESFSALIALRGDEGARTLLRSAAAIDLPGGELDIDTPEDALRYTPG